jgi:hypothetical protein
VRIPWRASHLLHQFKQYLSTLVFVMSPTAVFIPVVLPVLTVSVSGSEKKETVLLSKKPFGVGGLGDS